MGQASGTLVEVLVRPEAVEAVVDSRGHAVVAERTFPGSFTRIRVTLDDGAEPLIDAASRRWLPESGDRVSVRATGEDAIVSAAADGASAPAQ
jgi:hypothetical protein